MAQILDLGKIRFNWAGTYSNTTQYEYNDLVKYGPNLYAFTAAAAATGVLPTNTGSWAVVVEGFNFRSTYVNGTLYYKNDVVTDGVSAFIATAQHTAADSDINDNENFALLALGQSDLPSQLSAVNKVLTSDGTDTLWTATTYLTKGYWGSGQGQTASTIETSKSLTNAVSVFATTATDFAQLAFTNTSNAANASTDFIAYTDTGNNDSGFIDLGITSSGFADPDFTITGPNDGYIFMSGPRGDQKSVLLKQVLSSVATLTTSGAHGWIVGNTVRVEGVSEELDGEHVITAVPASNKFSYAAAGVSPFVETDVDPVGTSYRPVGEGNLVIATDASGLTNAIVFAAGGYYSNNTQMAIYPDSNVHIEIATASTSPTTGALTVVGGVGVSGDVNTSGSIYVGTDAKVFETNAGLTDTVAVLRGATDSFAQVAFVNGNNDAESSADVIVYSVAGDNDSGWIDMGITNPAFDSNTYGITGAGDGYIFMSGVADKTATVSSVARASGIATVTTTAAHGGFVGQSVTISGTTGFAGTFTISAVPNATTFRFLQAGAEVSTTASGGSVVISGGTGNLVLATADSGSENRIVFAAGGLASGNEQMIIAPDQFVHIEIATASTSPTTGALIVAGGMGLSGDLNTLGNVSFEGFLFSGNDAENWATTTATLTNPVAVFRYDSGVETSSYAQVAFQNTDPTSSTDFIVYMDNGNDDAGFWGFGIAGSEFDDAVYGITGPGDFYMFGDTVDDTYKGNMVFATGASGSENKIIFAAGGYASGNNQMVITPDQNIHIEIDTPSTSPTTGALTIVGGVGITGDMNVAGNVNIAGTIQFGGGGTTVETENLAVTDPMIFVGTDNLTDTLDLSFIGEHTYPTTLDPSAAITTKALTSNVATLTVTYSVGIEKFKAGDSITVAGVDATFNGTYTVTAATTTAPFTVSYAKTASNVASAPATTLTARNVTNKELASNVATLTTSGSHGFGVGESVTVTGVDATFNGAYVITATPSTTTFSYAKTSGDVPSQAATTAYASNVTQKSLTSNVATLTTSAAHGYSVGETVIVGSVDPTFNGTYTISAVTSTTFSYGLVASDVATTSTSGTATVNRLQGVATAAQYLGTANATDVFRPRYTGLSRDASDGKYKLFDLATTKPVTTVDFSEAGLVYATLKAKSIEATDSTSSFSMITLSGTPSASTDVATVAYVAAAAGGSWTIVTSNTTLTAGSFTFADTTTGRITLTLPASPAANTKVRIADVASKWGTNPVTLARNGSLIMGLAENLDLNVVNASVELVYANATYGWRIV